jgi:hypothetical protein
VDCVALDQSVLAGKMNGRRLALLMWEMQIAIEVWPVQIVESMSDDQSLLSGKEYSRSLCPDT